MPFHLSPATAFRAAALVAAILPALATGSALAQPVYKDTERFGPTGRPERPLRAATRPVPPVEPVLGRPYAPVTGSPGYVGSDYGLGKPAFTGLGSRPDWGHGGE